jgi:hypothetical protein
MTPRGPRKNLMLTATIAGGDVCAPVRIRNLSDAGAMIDGAALPEPGSTLTLTRLELSVGATVVWNEGGRCGLKLGGRIAVDDWIAGVLPATSRGSLGQMRVDQIQAALRSGAALPAECDASAAPAVDAGSVDQRIAAELAHVKQMLDAVGDQLMDDVGVLTRHERTLQSLDIATAIIESLAAVMASDERENAISAVPMHDLRSRLSGRLTLT